MTGVGVWRAVVVFVCGSRASANHSGASQNAKQLRLLLGEGSAAIKREKCASQHTHLIVRLAASPCGTS